MKNGAKRKKARANSIKYQNRKWKHLIGMEGGPPSRVRVEDF